MTYWTAMWITVLSGQFAGEDTMLVYPSLEDCEAALTAVSDTLRYDHSIICEESAAASGSIRPQPKPEWMK